MAKTVEELQEEIKEIKKSIHEKRFDISRYEDDLDRDSCYRRDSEKEARYNEYCDILADEISELETRLLKIEELLKQKSKREELKEEISRLEAQLKELEANHDSSYTSVLMELYGCKQDLQYLESLIKNSEKELYKENNRK